MVSVHRNPCRAASSFGLLVKDKRVVDKDLSVAGLDEPVDHLQRGGFAAAAGAQQDQRFALSDFKGNAIHCLYLAEVFAELMNFDHDLGLY